MHLTIPEAESALKTRLAAHQIADAADIAWAAVWLEACGYTGVKFLAEALADERWTLPLRRDALGIDLGMVSCAFLAPAIIRDVADNGRVFLRNVRHGLFMLPFSVRENMGIGCPVDPAFAVGGERHKNPYAEKLSLASAQGIAIDEAMWASIQTT
jgi:hypothetical protein